MLHVLESSIPQVNGYEVRARTIVDYQRRLGLDPVIVTSPLFRQKQPSEQIEEYDVLGLPRVRGRLGRAYCPGEKRGQRPRAKQIAPGYSRSSRRMAEYAEHGESPISHG